MNLLILITIVGAFFSGLFIAGLYHKAKKELLQDHVDELENQLWRKQAAIRHYKNAYKNLLDKLGKNEN